MKCLVSGREKKILVGFEKSIMLAIWMVPRWDVNSEEKLKLTKNSIGRVNSGIFTILELS